MTRWVRSGSTQKHKKMPGDATKWGEFDHQKKFKSEREMSFSKFKSNKSFDNRSKSNIKPFGNKEKSPSMNFSTSSKELEGNDHLKSCPTEKHSKDVDDKNSSTSSPQNKMKKEEHLRKIQKRKAEKGTMHLPSKVERKLYNIKKKLSEKGVPPNSVKEIIRKERTKAELNFRKTFNPTKLCLNCKKPGHISVDCPEKLGTSAQETGLESRSDEHTPFKYPQKVKGFPSDKKCYVCKEQGHISKDCPKNKHGGFPSDKKCYVCKEQGHISKDCPKNKHGGFPSGKKCYVCKEHGHISKDCPKNKHGAFLKGKRCNLCGNINHLNKDCPSLNKQKIGESSISLHTIKEKTSIDAEVMDQNEKKRKITKKPKIVKF